MYLILQNKDHQKIKQNKFYRKKSKTLNLLTSKQYLCTYK